MSYLEDGIIANAEGLAPASYIIGTYLLQGPPEEDMLARAAGLAVEQTVGRGVFSMPEFHHLVDERGGKLLSLIPVPDHESKPTKDLQDWQTVIARIAFPVENTAFQIPMLLTTLLSDASLGGMLKLVDIDLPSRFVDAFQGPKFGLDGIREMLSTERALICSILKPCVGVPPDKASEMFRQHALGGADVIKDDELMAYGGDYKMEDRVAACAKAAKQAFEETGEETLYLVSITDRPDRVMDNAKRAIEAGANGLMITPLTTGIATMQMLAEDPDITVPVFGHPGGLGGTSWSPDFGISEHILVGKLLRLAGADINAIPVPYGRFAHLREKFIKLFKVAKAPMRHIKPMFTQTGGGINPINASQVLADVGSDVMLVAGGSIQAHPMGLSAGIQAIRQSIEAYNQEMPLEQAAKKNKELGKAWELWGPKAS
jgi:2,3-diketo-5-methylthiopentyl-1-phosphate enolase